MIPTIINPQTKKFLLIAPVIVLPFLCLVFYGLGGGGRRYQFSLETGMGLNSQLPKAHFDPRKALQNKLGVYEQAERDSIRRQQFLRQDPYQADTATAKTENKTFGSRPLAPSDRKTAAKPVRDPRADRLLEQLNDLKRSFYQRQAAPTPRTLVTTDRHPWAPALSPTRPTDTLARDPGVERVNDMLDKVILIQHPEKVKPVPPVDQREVDELVPADSSVNTIAAVIPEDQTLAAGATIALRITDSIRINGRVLPGGQLVYGVVSFNNDRMLIRIAALRNERNLYTTDLQVYDLDGLAGIHIPGALGRDVAKQSADQGVNSLNFLNTDPSLGAQATSAGIQTAKSFLGHKVRQVRVSVRAGYEVMLKNMRAIQPKRSMGAEPMHAQWPAGFVPVGPVLKRCQSEGLELTLRGMYLQGDRLWFALEWSNHSAIRYVPAYLRWFIRDRHVFRRTAVQELVMVPASEQELPLVEADSVHTTLTGFRPFALAKGKELVLEAGEKNGGRVLILVLEEKQWSKIKNRENEQENQEAIQTRYGVFYPRGMGKAGKEDRKLDLPEQ